MGFFSALSHEKAPAWEKKPGLVLPGAGTGQEALLRAEVGTLPEFEEQVPVGAPRRELALRLQILARKGGEVLAVAVAR